MSSTRVRNVGIALTMTVLGLVSIGAQVPLTHADVDGDCVVTTTDVAIVRAGLGQVTPLLTPAADVNRDGRVNTTDLNFVMRNVGKVVCSSNRAPMANAGTDQRVITGQAVLLTGEGSTDPDGDPLTYEWVFLATPAGAAVSLANAATASPSFTPDRPGAYDLRLTVRDGRGGSAADDVRVLVDPPANRPPVITTSAVVEARAGEPYVYDVNATDPDGDVLAYTLPLAPPGMTIDASTGVISWTPPAHSAGVRSARVQVDDGRGAVASQGFAIDLLAPVPPVNQPPVAAHDRYDVGLGQTLVVAPSGVLANDTDPDGQPLAARLIAGPGEGALSLQPDGGFTYTPRPVVASGGALNPVVEWRHSTFRAERTVNQAMTTPVVIDANRDGVPEIYVQTYFGTGGRRFRALTGGPTLVTNFNLVGLNQSTLQVSSVFSGHHGDLAVDRNVDTAWGASPTDASPFFEVTFPSATLVRELRFLGNRAADAIHDFSTGRFELFDGSGGLLYTSGSVALPAPGQNLALVLPTALANVQRVRFTGTQFATAGVYHGFAELEVIGDAVALPGTELWSLDEQVVPDFYPGIAAGDLDGDGFAEIVTRAPNGLVALNHDGTVKWVSTLAMSDRDVTPSLADLDGDGRPEIVVGSAVVNHDGTVRVGPHADNGSNGGVWISTVADLNLDGRPEILTGKSAYRADGSVFWTSTQAEGFTAVGNFDADPFPEIVVVSAGTVRLLEHDGVIKWGPVALPGGGRGGPPTVADVDSDGQPEIGVAGSTRYVVFETDGSVKWQVVIQDASSHITGSSVFDFEGDGSAEIVYGDEEYLRILRGVDGAELYRVRKTSGTRTEVPLVVDVDADGQAEIVAVANGTDDGVFVIGGGDHNWIPTRAIWNQHTYHITNVNADGSIPRTEPQHWLVPGLNVFRTNGFAPGDPDRTTSFTYRASDGDLESSDAVVRITLRQPNSPPVIHELSGGAAAVGVEYLFGVTVSDPDIGDTHTFELLAGPAGLTLEPATGLVRWTPGAGQLGNHDVTLRVLDHRGLSAVSTFTISVALPVAVPDVTGITEAAAAGQTRAAGLNVAPVTRPYSLTTPSGIVIAQAPVAGTLVAPGTSMYLQVSAGLEPVPVPTLVGLSQADATALLTASRLTLGAVTLAASNTVRPGAVAAQNPAAGMVAGVTSAVDVTVSTGPALSLTFQRAVIPAGAATPFLVEAYDPTGLPLTPLPPVTLSLTAEPGESSGTPPAIVQGAVTTSADTRGVFTLRATSASGDTASAVLVVSRPGAVGPAQYSTLGEVMTAMAGDLRSLETALLSGQLAAIPALRDALVATRGRLNLRSLAGSTAFAPEGGFPPTLAELSAAGFPETAADVAWNSALRDVIATIQAIETVLVELRPEGTLNDDLRLQQLNGQLETRVAALVAIRPSLHGIVRRANVVNQLVSIRIPRLIDAQVAAIERALGAAGLARNVEPLGQFYAGVQAAPADPFTPASYYERRRFTFFTMPSLMSATRIQMDIIRNVYAPVMREVVKGGVLVTAQDLLRPFRNAGSLVSIVTGASASFHVFEAPWSMIEGFGFDPDFPEGNQVFAVGPDTINQFQEMLAPLSDHPESFDDLGEMVDFFDGVREGAETFGANFNPDNLAPWSVLRGCIFDASPACSELVFLNGIRSVHSSGSFPAPVLFLVRNVTTGNWDVLVAPFLPTH